MKQPKYQVAPNANPSILPDIRIGSSYSLHNLLRGLVDPGSGAGGYEAEVSAEFARALGRNPTGVFVPTEALARALTVNPSGGSTGGKLVATNLLASNFIDLLRNRAVVVSAGATVLSGLVGNIAIPRQTGSATAYWLAESGAPTESGQTFDQVTLSPKTVGAFTDISRRMVLQSSLDISSLVAGDILASVSLAIDRAAIAGTGGTQPTGILNTAGVQTLPLGGAAPTWGNIVDMETMVAQENADSMRASMGYAIAPALAGKLRQTFRNATYGQDPILSGPRADPRMNGHRVHISNQVPAQHMIFGNWSDIIIGQWGVLDLMVDPYSLGTSGGVRIVAMQDVDVAIRHPESFVVVPDAGLS